jgi:hypothetical protein
MAKTLSPVCYITNYATKDDVSPSQILLKVALLRRSIEGAKAALDPNEADLRIKNKGMDQFALRSFNTLSHDQEISAVQIASSLLQKPNHYTNNYNFVQINLWWLRQYVRSLMDLTTPLTDDSPVGTFLCSE